jgi:hypothetical protein
MLYAKKEERKEKQTTYDDILLARHQCISLSHISGD